MGMRTRLQPSIVFCFAFFFAQTSLHAQSLDDAPSTLERRNLSLSEHKKALAEIIRTSEGDAQIEAAEILARIDDELKIPLLEQARKVFNKRSEALSLKVERDPKGLRIVVENDDLDLINNVVLQSLRADQRVAKEISFEFDSESPLEEIALSAKKGARVLARDQYNNVLLVYEKAALINAKPPVAPTLTKPQTEAPSNAPKATPAKAAEASFFGNAGGALASLAFVSMVVSSAQLLLNPDDDFNYTALAIGSGAAFVAGIALTLGDAFIEPNDAPHQEESP